MDTKRAVIESLKLVGCSVEERGMFIYDITKPNGEKIVMVAKFIEHLCYDELCSLDFYPYYSEITEKNCILRIKQY